MPRRKAIYSDYYPFHITARTISGDWFSLPQELVWCVFVERLNHLKKEVGLKTHAFVLMSNHYHLLASVDPLYDIEHVVQRLQGWISLELNLYLRKTFYVFEEPTKSSIITTPTYYKRVLKYVYRNPVEADVCEKVEDYRYSTLNSDQIKTVFPYNIDFRINYRKEKMLPWLNDENCPDWSRIEVFRELLSKDFSRLFPRSY